MKTITFRATVRKQFEHIRQSDIIVGDPGFNDAQTTAPSGFNSD